MATSFRCTLIEEDGRRTVREISARDREHAHLLALVGGATPLAIVPSAPSVFQRAWAGTVGAAPEQLLVDLAVVVRSGRSASEALDGLAPRAVDGHTLRAISARVATGQRLAPSIRAEMAMPRWIEAALEIEPKRSDEHHVEVIAKWIHVLDERRRDAATGAFETIALVLIGLLLLATNGPLGGLAAALTTGAAIYLLASKGPIGHAIARLRTARFLAIVSALIELGAAPRHAIDLAADEIGDAHKSVALRAAVAVAPETMPIDRLLSVPIDLPAVAALLLSGDALPADAAALASADLHARAVRKIRRAMAIARAAAILMLGIVAVVVITR